MAGEARRRASREASLRAEGRRGGTAHWQTFLGGGRGTERFSRASTPASPKMSSSQARRRRGIATTARLYSIRHRPHHLSSFTPSTFPPAQSPPRRFQSRRRCLTSLSATDRRQTPRVAHWPSLGGECIPLTSRILASLSPSPEPCRRRGIGRSSRRRPNFDQLFCGVLLLVEGGFGKLLVWRGCLDKLLDFITLLLAILI